MVTPGTSSGRVQSALLIPVPQADSVVGQWRYELDPVAAAGVPAHVTLIVPWLPPAEIDESDLAELDDELSGIRAFDFRLNGVGWFERRVLWVAPEPADPFIELTNRLAARFSTPPWEDEFDDLVPHLTVAHATDGVELTPIAAAVSELLPIACRRRRPYRVGPITPDRCPGASGTGRGSPRWSSSGPGNRPRR
jgi:2'-5' RNA ligase